eukprot:2082961-Amphidinium_carterae.1
MHAPRPANVGHERMQSSPETAGSWLPVGHEHDSYQKFADAPPGKKSEEKIASLLVCFAMLFWGVWDLPNDRRRKKKSVARKLRLPPLF